MVDIRDLLTQVDNTRLVRRTGMQTAFRMTAAGVIPVLLASIIKKPKIFGGTPSLCKP